MLSPKCLNPLNNLSPFEVSDKRVREAGEITQVTASRSKSQFNSSWFAAENAIDLNLKTSFLSNAGSGGSHWLQLKFDQVYCVEQVRTYRKNGKPERTWICNNTDCSHCDGYHCGVCSLDVSTAETSSNDLPQDSECRYGDTVKLQCNTGTILMVYEISVIGRQGG